MNRQVIAWAAAALTWVTCAASESFAQCDQAYSDFTFVGGTPIAEVPEMSDREVSIFATGFVGGLLQAPTLGVSRGCMLALENCLEDGRSAEERVADIRRFVSGANPEIAAHMTLEYAARVILIGDCGI